MYTYNTCIHNVVALSLCTYLMHCIITPKPDDIITITTTTTITAITTVTKITTITDRIVSLQLLPRPPASTREGYMML